MTRVLFFSIYANWSYHTALETTWAHALKLRGADVQFVTCNGLSGACDIYRETLNPRDPESCLACQAKTSTLFSNLRMPYEWLGTFLPLGVREQAQAWVDTLTVDSLLEAHWRGLDVGRWAATSAYNQFRTAKLDMDDPKVVGIVRDLLIGTVVYLEALNVLFDTHRPDTLVLLNGRFFGHWAAIELAKRKGIRFITHERGFNSDTIRFSENHRTHELDGMHELWNEWRDIPLLPEEIASTSKVLEDRRMGRNYSRIAFGSSAQSQETIVEKLRLDSRPIVVVFTSSDDETAAFPERLRGAFPRSADFLPAVLERARNRPSVQFVVRIHPNIQKRQSGTNETELRHAQEIQKQAPENMRVVMPLDDLSSYALIDMADLGIVYASTIGLEMAVTGKPVLCIAQATYSHTGAVIQIDEPDHLGPALDSALSTGVDLEKSRIAMRWAHRYFSQYAIPFPLVHGPADDSQAVLKYANYGELAPGRHAVLDRVCQSLLGEVSSVLPEATEADRNRDLQKETEALADCFQLGSYSQRATTG